MNPHIRDHWYGIATSDFLSFPSVRFLQRINSQVCGVKGRNVHTTRQPRRTVRSWVDHDSVLTLEFAGRGSNFRELCLEIMCVHS
ncbi:hypothetical protein RRG08_008989 [Elysia crispata]|uniref:Uncharacterized protein n=1 Tax=Elysia crispata TaxID=231223 RepID=A0AAE0YU76_9GAST|nr:hypothetical protein RRG08_008989 [Elysia crispata]